MYSIIYTYKCETKNHAFACPASFPASTHFALARPQRLLGPGAQTLHPPGLPGLCARGQTSGLFAFLHQKRTPAMYVRADTLGFPAPAGAQKWAAHGRIA